MGKKYRRKNNYSLALGQVLRIFACKFVTKLQKGACNSFYAAAPSFFDNLFAFYCFLDISVGQHNVLKAYFLCGKSGNC
jgi:hypothetical protein